MMLRRKIVDNMVESVKGTSGFDFRKNSWCIINRSNSDKSATEIQEFLLNEVGLTWVSGAKLLNSTDIGKFIHLTDSSFFGYQSDKFIHPNTKLKIQYVFTWTGSELLRDIFD